MISALSNKISRNVAVFKYSSIISMYILSITVVRICPVCEDLLYQPTYVCALGTILQGLSVLKLLFPSKCFNVLKGIFGVVHCIVLLLL